MTETSITIFLASVNFFNSFLPVFNMPGYTPNIFKIASVEDFWLLFKRLRKMNYLYSFRWDLNLIVLTMDISSAD